MFDWLKKKRQSAQADGGEVETASASDLAVDSASDPAPAFGRDLSPDPATRTFPLEKPPGPDFSAVDTLAKAQELHRQGVLAPLFLMPPEFGGENVAFNIVYVPPFAAEMKQHLDQNVIRGLITAGKASCYTAQPAYQGDSFVPASITVEASEPGSFSSVIRIWGEGLGGLR